MTMKFTTMTKLLGTAAAVVLLGGSAAMAQSAIRIGHLADYSGGTSVMMSPSGLSR